MKKEILNNSLLLLFWGFMDKCRSKFCNGSYIRLRSKDFLRFKFVWHFPLSSLPVTNLILCNSLLEKLLLCSALSIDLHASKISWKAAHSPKFDYLHNCCLIMLLNVYLEGMVAYLVADGYQLL